jgi:hypothetical protein
MPRSFIHKFRVSGIYNSADVAAVRNRLTTLPGVTAVSVDLRKMQAQITASRVFEALALRNALGNADFGLSGLSTSAIITSSGVRDDEIDEPAKSN